MHRFKNRRDAKEEQVRAGEGESGGEDAGGREGKEEDRRIVKGHMLGLFVL